MLFFSLDQKAKDGLKGLSGLDDEVASSLIDTAISSLVNNHESCTSSQEEFSAIVEGVVTFITQATRAKLSSDDLIEALEGLDVNKSIAECLGKAYGKHQTFVRDALSLLDSQSSNLPYYSNLEWRFEVQIASRALKNQTEANVLLKLELERGNGGEFENISCNPANLVHLLDTLEEALIEGRSQHFQKISRHLK